MHLRHLGWVPPNALTGSLPRAHTGVSAPIKRPYIWDIAPSVSAIRYCMRNRLHVYLLEWMPASRDIANNGLDEYGQGISECIAKITTEPRGATPFLVGHSLGGTLAAIFAASAPQSARGLVLLGAPLCFQPGTSHFRDALVSLVPSALSETDPFPGSLLSQMSALASPATFICSRLMDAAFSIADYRALDVYFCRGILKLGKTFVGPFSLAAPTLAAVNTADDVAPLASVKPFIDAMPPGKGHIIEYLGEVGVCLQHLGILVGRRAHAHVWPQITSWLHRAEFFSSRAHFAGSAICKLRVPAHGSYEPEVRIRVP
jgi:polyhydroxyalkanoate synthase